MPRYIDADALMKKIAKCKFHLTGCGIVYDGGEVQSIIHTMPTADVAPKSDVERLERICHSYALQYGTVTDQQKVIDKAKAEVAREIFEEIGKILYKHTKNAIKEKSATCELTIDYIGEDIAELKKKYTEENV